MKSRLILLFCTAALLWEAAPAPVEAQDIRSVIVQTVPGQTQTQRDTIIGRTSISYRIHARAGQTLTLALYSSNTATYFNVYAPGKAPGDEAMATSEHIGPMVPEMNRFRARLTKTGVHTVNVYLFRNAARRGERSDFALDIALSAPEQATQLPDGPGTSAPLPPNEPGFWAVSGLLSGHRLNVRSGPSTSDPVVFTLKNGQTVRNIGCSVQPGGARWCQIDRIGKPGKFGWVSARFLVPARAPGGSTQLPGNALVPGTGYNATGSLPCAFLQGGPMGTCQYGIIRRGNGNATLVLRLPLGGERRIEFQAGRPVSANAAGRVYGEWQGDSVNVFVGSTERYSVPETVLWGG